MIRTKTTLIVGTGASGELELPDARELLTKIAQGFDFARLGTDLQTRDMIVFAQYFEKLASGLKTTPEKLREAGETIRTSARIASSIDAILEQHGHDPLVLAVGKLAIVHYTLQAEARSPMGAEPRDPGDLPLRGVENWLFQIGRAITSGVPRARAEQCFDNLSIICFTYDRSLLHYLPFVLHMAFGMTLGEARQLVGEKLRILYPYGCAGRLPWQPGEGAEVEWGSEEPANLPALAGGVYTASERARDDKFQASLAGEMAQGGRLVFLGFGFDPQSTAMLFEQPLGHDPDVLVALTGMRDAEKAALLRLLEQRMGSSSAVSLVDMRAYQFLRDYSLLLES